MGIQITIIGLDRIGQSLGMALKNSKNPVTRIGFDLDAASMKAAEKSDAVEKTMLNLHAAVEKADIILLNLTGGEVLEYAAEISPSLKEGATLVNLAPVHTAMCEWGMTNLPKEVSLINATPILAGGMLDGDDPSASLFRGSVCVITSPQGTSASSIQLVVDLAGLLGASPLFSDPVEADGLLTLADLFPRLVSHLYLQAVSNQAGWMEAGKTAGTAFFNISKPVGQFVAGKFGAREILLQKGNVLRYLNLLQGEIEDLKSTILNNDEDTLNKTLQHSIDEHNLWFTRRITGEWGKNPPAISNAPSSGLKKLLGIEIPAKKR